MYSSDPPLTQRTGASCAEHGERPASTICTRCGSYACDLCLRVGNDHQDYCFRCVSLVQPLADPGPRLVAVLIDRFFVAIPLIVTSFFGVLFGADHVFGFVLWGMLGSLVLTGYQLYLLVTTRQSLGKRVMGIQVVRTDGSPIDLVRLILLRNVVPAFINSATCGIFDIVDPLFVFTADRRCLHDHIADSKVIKVNGPTL